MAEEVDQKSSPKPTKSTGERPTEWFLIEIWFDNRRLFKKIVKHVIIFVFFALVLEVYHRGHEHSQLPPDEAAWLNAVHFWGYIFLLVVLGFCLAIKILIIELQGLQE